MYKIILRVSERKSNPIPDKLFDHWNIVPFFNFTFIYEQNDRVKLKVQKVLANIKIYKTKILNTGKF